MGNLSLLMVLAFLVGYSYVGYRVRSTQEIASNRASDAVASTNLKLTSASAINRALSILSLDATVRTDVTGNINGGSFRVRIIDPTLDPTLGATQVRLISSVQLRGKFDTTMVLLQFPSFSRFSYMTGVEGNIWFATGDTIRGPLHTNDYFRMQGRPAFMDDISSAIWYTSTEPYRKYDASTNPYFGSTTNFGAPILPIPLNLDPQRNAAISNGIRFSNTTLYVQFNANGTYQTRESPTGAWTVRSRPNNGVIFVGPALGTTTGYNVYVQGVVSGQWTLAVQGNIFVTSDIVYANNPLTTPSSTDILGLVARLNCVVTSNSYLTNRTIHAHIMTMNGGTTAVTSNFYNDTYNSILSGQLNVFGGIAQVRRGAVAQMGTPGTGYKKNYIYDNRLREFSPPSYPISTVLQQLYYWE